MPWLLAAALGSWLLYIIVLYWALRSDAVRHAINRRPDKFFITWRSASSWFPGLFHVQGLHFIGQGTASQYYGRMDDARFRVQLLPLLRQVISVGTFKGRGVEFQLRRPPAAGGTNPPPPDFIPPIPGLDSLPPRTSPRSGRGKPSWWIRVENVVFQDIQRIWLYGSRLDGPGTLTAALDMQIEGPFQVRARHLQFPQATLTHNGTPIATSLALQLSGDMGPLTFDVDDVPDDRIFEFISGDLRLAADLATVALLREQLGPRDGIQFAGEGRIEGDVRVVKGRLHAGTQLAIRSPKLQLTLGGYLFEGAATIEDRVASEGPDSVAKLAVNLRDLAIFRDGKPIGSAAGPLLRLTSDSRNPKVTSGFRDADLALHLEPLSLPDASWLTEFLPASSGIALTGGAIRLQADLRAAPHGPVRGHLHLDGDAVSTRIHGNAYEGTLQLAVQLADGAGGPDVLHLEDTRLTLTNLFVPKLSRETQEGWHASLRIPEGRLDLTNKAWSLDGRFHLELRDTRPILAVLKNQPDAPGWLHLMPTIKDLVGGGRVATTRDLTQLSAFTLRGKNTDFRAELILSTQRLSGIAYARYGPLAAGMDRRDPQRSRWRLIGAKRWFERAQATPHVAPDQAEPEEPDDPKDFTP